MLPNGHTAPDFELPDHADQPVRLRERLADGPVVLYFYPRDDTPGCTKEACDFRDIHGELSAAGLQVIGISPQRPASHAAFRERHHLPFTLLSDPDRAVAKLYDALGPFGLGVARVTYLIGHDGVIQDSVRAEWAIGRHGEFVRRAMGR